MRATLYNIRLRKKLFNGALYLLVLIFLLPEVILAFGPAGRLQSASFILDDVNFASNISLSSSKDGTPPAISNNGPRVTQLTPSSATIVWETDKKASSEVQYGKTTARQLIAGSNETSTVHSVTLSGLVEETPYHFIVVSRDAFGNIGKSTDYTFATPAQTQFQEISITQVTYTSALIGVKTGGIKTVRVLYGTSSNLKNAKQVATVTSTTENNFPLTELEIGTKYFLRIEGEDSSGATIKVAGLSFTTLANPAITTIYWKAISPNEGDVAVQTNTPVTVTLSYKSNKDTDNQSAGDTELKTEHVFRLSKLFGNADYQVIATATDAGGKRVVSKPSFFATPSDTTPPVATDPTVAVNRVGNQIAATVRWEANEPIQGKVVITSKINSKDTVVVLGATLFTPNQNITASSLKPSTPYELQAVSTDSSGNVTTKTINFVTPSIQKSILDLISQNLSRLFAPLAKLFNSL